MRTLIKYWNILWGFIGGLTLVVGLIGGLFTLYDRFSPLSEQPAHLKEYIFGNQYYYAQFLVNNVNKVVSYGITSRKSEFNPTFTILPHAYSVDLRDPSNLEKATSLAKHITLGKTKFSDIGDKPENIFGYLGARRFHYNEEHYYGNPGNYQSYFFAANDSGYLEIDNNNLDFLFEIKISPNDSIVDKFRKGSKINTFYVTAPLGVYTYPGIAKYLVGPDYDQVRVISDSAIETKNSKEMEYIKLSKLSTEVEINNIVDILGKPIIINDRPYLEVR